MTKENAALLLLEKSLEQLRKQYKLDVTEVETQEESAKRLRERIQQHEERMEDIEQAITILKGDDQ